jgi:hypothetical protein
MVRDARRCRAPHIAVIPRLDRGIQYAADFRFLTDALEYWVARFRGR